MDKYEGQLNTLFQIKFKLPFDDPNSLLIGTFLPLNRNEISRIRTASFLKAINLALSFITTRIILFLVLLTYIWLGNLPTARVVFVTMALLNVIRGTVTTYFPQAVAALAEVKVSCGRIQVD